MFTKKVLGNILNERNFLHKDIFSRNNKTTASVPATFSGLVGGSGGLYKPGTDASKTNILLGGAGTMPVYNMANPATKFAHEQGFKTEIVSDPKGGQRGLIVLPGGKTIDEWEYYRQFHESLTNTNIAPVKGQEKYSFTQAMIGGPQKYTLPVQPQAMISGPQKYTLPSQSKILTPTPNMKPQSRDGKPILFGRGLI